MPSLGGDEALLLPSQNARGHRGGTRAPPAPSKLLSASLTPGLGLGRTGGGLAVAQTPWPGGRTTQGPRLRRSLETLPQRRAADRRLDGGSGKTPLLSLAPAGEGKWGDCRARGTGSAPTRTYRGECTASGRSGGDARRGDPPSSPLAGHLIRSACAV